MNTLFKTIGIALLLAGSVSAQVTNANEDATRGVDLIEEGARLFFKGLQQELEPALDELQIILDAAGPKMQAFVETFGPNLKDLLNEVEDWSVYDAPEILPNGDIIIRRKTDKGQNPSDQIDL